MFEMTVPHIIALVIAIILLASVIILANQKAQLKERIDFLELIHDDLRHTHNDTEQERDRLLGELDRAISARRDAERNAMRVTNEINILKRKVFDLTDQHFAGSLRDQVLEEYGFITAPKPEPLPLSQRVS